MWAIFHEAPPWGATQHLSPSISSLCPLPPNTATMQNNWTDQRTKEMLKCSCERTARSNVSGQEDTYKQRRQKRCIPFFALALETPYRKGAIFAVILDSTS